MAKQYDQIETSMADFIRLQHIYFVSTAGPDGHVNLSPKGGDSLRVVDQNRIIWRNLTGSGNETAGHLLENPRMTLMWCSFELRPLILRAYGTARTIHVGDDGFAELDAHFTPHIGTRQIYDMHVDMMQTSCGYAVPFMEFQRDRDTLDKWSDDRGADAIATYWQERNSTTIDGKPTR